MSDETTPGTTAASPTPPASPTPLASEPQNPAAPPTLPAARAPSAAPSGAVTVNVASSASAAASARATLARPAVAWVVAAVMTLAAAGFAATWAPLYTEARDRERVREVAEDLVLHLTTFEGATIDEWVQTTQRHATDEYAEEVNALFDPDLRAALKQAQAKSVGRLVNLFVQDVDGDRAMVFAVLRQTITNAATTAPVEDELRMQIELRRDGGRWKAATVEVLGPQGAGGRAPLPLDEPGTDQPGADREEQAGDGAGGEQ